MKPIILIRPNASKQYQNLNKLRAIEPPTWLACLASKYEKPIIIDAEAENLSHEQVLGLAYSYKPEHVVILATGSHPSAHIQQTEAMEQISWLFEEQGIHTNNYDSLPFDPTETMPKWNLLDMSKYRAHNWHCWGGLKREPYGAIFTSISCPFKCEFCTIKSFYNSEYKQRKALDVLEDTLTQYEKHGIRNFKIMDELFAMDNIHTKGICNELALTIGKDINIWAYARIDTVNEILLKNMRKAGVRWLAYGIESGNDDIRKAITKGNFKKDKIRDIIMMTKDCGIHIVGNYIFGFKKDTEKTMRETLDFALELETEYANFYCLVAYPGSKLYNDMKAQGIRMPEHSDCYAQMSEMFEPLATDTVNSQDVLRFRDEAFIEYFTQPNYLDTIRRKFGEKTVDEITDMTKIKLERDLLK